MAEKKKILLTGGNGFIGKNLKESLQGKYEILAPRSFELDLRSREDVACYFKDNRVDFVIHCATVGGARGIEDSPDTIDANLSMVENILFSKREDVRVILFGSGAMYDKSRSLHKVKEADIGDVVPNDLYGKSKMMIAQKNKNRDDVLCLNIFACYGYGEKAERFPTYAIKRVLSGQDIQINQNVVFDYLFVEDMQKIIHYFIENKPKDNIINITPDLSISLMQIAEIVNCLGTKRVEVIVENPIMSNEYTGSNELLRKNMGGVGFTSYEEGLKKLFVYIKKNMPIV